MNTSTARSAGNECAPHPVLDLDACQAIGPDGQRVDIPPAQLTLLTALVGLPPGHVLPWQAAVRLIYGDHAAAEWHNYREALWSLCTRLNRKLRGVGWPRSLVQTARGNGLRLVVPSSVNRQREIDKTTERAQ